MKRREFLERSLAGTGAVIGSALLGSPAAGGAMRQTPDVPILGNRFFTFNTTIRVKMCEETRTTWNGRDEYELHKPEHVEAFRDAFAKGWPGGPMTWTFSWMALFDPRPHYEKIREMVRQYHDRYGDDVTYLPAGFFPNKTNTREQVSRDIHEALTRIEEFMGRGFRPKSLVAGYLAADNLRNLAEKEGIHVCQGNIWSQYDIDDQDGDGSICYPYYPSSEHFCKPAQGKSDFIDCLNLDGWSMDFLAARRPGFQGGFNSRLGVGPFETLFKFGAEIGLREMLATTAAHFDTGFSLNRWAWVNNLWEVTLVALYKDKPNHLDSLTRWLTEIRRRWPDTCCMTLGDFGLAYRRQFRDNKNVDWRFVQRGTGIGGSDENLEIRWFMNQRFRLALLRDWKSDGPERVIDFTRYDLPAREPQGLRDRRWSLMGQINQKGTRPQDKPVALGQLPAEDRQRILGRYPELKNV